MRCPPPIMRAYAHLVGWLVIGRVPLTERPSVPAPPVRMSAPRPLR